MLIFVSWYMNWFLAEQSQMFSANYIGHFGRALNLWGSLDPVAQIAASVHQTDACLVALGMQSRRSTMYTGK